MHDRRRNEEQPVVDGVVAVGDAALEVGADVAVEAGVESVGLVGDAIGVVGDAAAAAGELALSAIAEVVGSIG